MLGSMLPAESYSDERVATSGMLRSIVTVMTVILLGTGICQAQNFGAPEGSDFRLEWEVEQSRRGRPTITGYIYNERFLSVTNVQLLVEQLDSSGRVVSKTIGYIDSGVRIDGRRYFEVPVPTAGATYRLTVHSFDVIGPGPSGP